MNKFKIFLLAIIIGASSCGRLEYSPLDQGSSENWYSSETQFEMAINDFYRMVWWNITPTPNVVSWDDDLSGRSDRSTIVAGTMTSETGFVNDFWKNQYKAIGRANAVITNLEKGRGLGISETKLTQYEAEARFMLANCYARLVFAFGDVPLVTRAIDLEEGFQMARTPKDEVIEFIYENFDFAIDNLPRDHTQKMRATKGAALALKARHALYFGDYELAREAAKACIDLDKYSLHNDYEKLFLTKNASEAIFLIPRSLELNRDLVPTQSLLFRTGIGGWAYSNPTWALLASYECTDGLPIDESPLFNPQTPFENRDPRCTATILKFGETFLGIDYNPHPNAVRVRNHNTGLDVWNTDTRGNSGGEFASFNGLVWKKGIDESWLAGSGYQMDNDFIVIRYADVLLMYAEAMVELNEIDDSVLRAINTVRARAYGTNPDNIANYPALQTLDQSELRKRIRNERRVEFPLEGLRYFDLIRWRLAKKALNKPNPGILYPKATLLTEVVNKGHWFWAYTPQIDEDGIPDFTQLLTNKKAMVLSEGNWDDRQYLWPIPSKELIINTNMVPNPGY